LRAPGFENAYLASVDCFSLNGDFAHVRAAYEKLAALEPRGGDHAVAAAAQGRTHRQSLSVFHPATKPTPLCCWATGRS
jgi:hypothetical protein